MPDEIAVSLRMGHALDAASLTWKYAVGTFGMGTENLMCTLPPPRTPAPARAWRCLWGECVSSPRRVLVAADPTGVSVCGDEVFVVDHYNHRLQVAPSRPLPDSRSAR